MQLSPSELRPERERRGLSRPALALLSSISAGVIGRIETSGKASCATMQALSDALIGTVKAEDVHFWRERAGLEARIAASSDVDLDAPKDALQRAVPAIVWPDDPKEPAKIGCFELRVVRVCNAAHDWHWYAYPGEDLEEIEGGEADSLEDARRDCEAAFLRLVGAGS